MIKLIVTVHPIVSANDPIAIFQLFVLAAFAVLFIVRGRKHLHVLLPLCLGCMIPIWIACRGDLWQICKTALFVLALADASLSDLKTRTVPYMALAGIAAAGVFPPAGLKASLAWAAGVFLLFVILTLVMRQPLPGGDVKLIVCCSFFFGDERGLYGAMAGCVLVLLELAGRKLLRRPIPQTVPFVPYLSVGYYLCRLLG